MSNIINQVIGLVVCMGGVVVLTIILKVLAIYNEYFRDNEYKDIY